MAKRRKRKVRLNSAPTQHRTDATRLYQYAKDAQLDAKEAKTCKSALRSLASAQSYAAQAGLSNSGVGPTEGQQTKKIGAAISNLRREIAKEFEGTLTNCGVK
jgi:hypothetical protein